MPPVDTTVTQESEETAQARPAARPEIDLDLLAKKVFQLLKENIEVERDRLGRQRTW